MLVTSRLVILTVLLSGLASAARGQGAEADSSFRVAVIGQTDSTGLALAERVRARLTEVMRGRRSVVVSARDVAVTLAMAYRGPTDPIGLQDIREVGKLVRADIVLGLVPDTVRAGNVEAIVFRLRARDFQSRPRGARRLGSWPAARIGPSSSAIFRAFQTDSLYRRIVGR